MDDSNHLEIESEIESEIKSEIKSESISESEEVFHLGDVVEEEIFHLEGSEPDDFFMEVDGDTITVDAVSDALYTVLEFVDRKLWDLGCKNREMQQVRLVMEEIFINICSYAYPEGVGRARVNSRIVMDETGENALDLYLTFRDQGIPFNPLDREEVDTSGTQFMEQVGGFGIHLVKSLMDHVEYEYTNGENVLKMEKRLFAANNATSTDTK